MPDVELPDINVDPEPSAPATLLPPDPTLAVRTVPLKVGFPPTAPLLAGN